MAGPVNNQFLDSYLALVTEHGVSSAPSHVNHLWWHGYFAYFAHKETINTINNIVRVRVKLWFYVATKPLRFPPATLLLIQGHAEIWKTLY